MRQASPELIALLSLGDFERADLYTLILKGGNTLRFTSEDRDIHYLGNTFNSSLQVSRESIEDVLGLEASSLRMVLSVNSGDPEDQLQVGGKGFIEFASHGGLKGASLKLERAFLPSWNDPITGTVTRFLGRITSIDEISGLSVKATVHSWSLLLNTNYPSEVYQTGCMWVLYNAGCGLLESSFTSSFTSLAGSTESTLLVSGGGGPDYNQGRIVITSGYHSGLSRTIRNCSPGSFELLSPLPSPLLPGDTFNASFGCDLTHGTCDSRFNNKLRFKGTPFIPTPETSL